MNTCSICLENLSSKHIVLDCKHEYHINCIKQIKNNKCPLCRRNIVDKEYCNNSHRPVFFNSGFIGNISVNFVSGQTTSIRAVIPSTSNSCDMRDVILELDE